VNERVEIVGGADPLSAAAIVAAVMRLAEEQAWAASVPPASPAQTPWVLSTRPRPVQPVMPSRPAPTTLGWSVASDNGDSS